MSPENEKKLADAFPLLYVDRRDTPMAWGFQCGDGWFDLIYRMSEKLEARIVKLAKLGGMVPRAIQVKEKFGELRVYMSFYDDMINEAINDAREQSAVTCEACGKPGEMKTVNDYIFTECEACHEARKS